MARNVQWNCDNASEAILRRIQRDKKNFCPKCAYRLDSDEHKRRCESRSSVVAEPPNPPVQMPADAPPCPGCKGAARRVGGEIQCIANCGYSSGGE